MKKKSKKAIEKKEIDPALEKDKEEVKRLKESKKELENLKNAGKIDDIYKQALSIVE